MSDSMAEYESEFITVTDEIDLGIKDLSRLKKRPAEVTAKAQLLKNRLTRANQLLKSFKIEIRSLPKENQREHEKRAKQFEERVKTLDNELNWAEKQNENGGAGAAGGEASIQDEYNQTIQQAKNLQKKDIETTDRIIQDVIIMNEIGTSTAEQMAFQEEQMQRIAKGMDEVDSNLKLAQRQMRAFARKMATDKLIMGLVLLIVLAIIAAIVVKIVKK